MAVKLILESDACNKVKGIANFLLHFPTFTNHHSDGFSVVVSEMVRVKYDNISFNNTH